MNNIVVNNKEYEIYDSFVQNKNGDILNVKFAITHIYWWEDIINDFDINSIIPFDYDICGITNLWTKNNIIINTQLLTCLNNYILSKYDIKYILINDVIIVIVDSISNIILNKSYKNICKQYNLKTLIICGFEDKCVEFIDF